MDMVKRRKIDYIWEDPWATPFCYFKSSLILLSIQSSMQKNHQGPIILALHNIRPKESRETVAHKPSKAQGREQRIFQALSSMHSTFLLDYTSLLRSKLEMVMSQMIWLNHSVIRLVILETNL